MSPTSLRDLRARLRLLTAPSTNPHETRGSSIVRPVVFGATDGLVSNLSLIMGVAAASKDAQVVVVAGIAGLLAGGFSMAVGEYVSVKGQREVLDYQINLQRHQLEHTPEQERAILMDIYQMKGLSEPEARLITDRVLSDPERAVDTFVREEIGLSAATMGSPVGAAIGSFAAFASGAFVPLLPFLLGVGGAAFPLAIGLAIAALFMVGTGVSRLTHRNPIWIGLRQAGLGGLAAAVTYGVGALLGAAAA